MREPDELKLTVAEAATSPCRVCPRLQLRRERPRISMSGRLSSAPRSLAWSAGLATHVPGPLRGPSGTLEGCQLGREEAGSGGIEGSGQALPQTSSSRAGRATPRGPFRAAAAWRNRWAPRSGGRSRAARHRLPRNRRSRPTSRVLAMTWSFPTAIQRREPSWNRSDCECTLWTAASWRRRKVA